MKTQIKKLLSILTLIAILCSIICVPTSARELRQDEFVGSYGKKFSADGNWTYIKPAEFNEGEIAIVEYKGTDTEVIIPETVDGYTVVAVGDQYEDVNSSSSDKLLSKLFADDLNVAKVTLPKTFKKFGIFVYDCYSLGDDQYDCFNVFGATYSSFAKESITKYIIDENNPYFSSEDGIIYNKDKTELVLYPTGKTDEVFTLPESVKSFSNYAFAYSKLKRVENFDNVTELSKYLFAYSSIEEFPKMENIQEIASYAFAYCNNLKNVTIPLRVDDVNNHAFYYCKNLEEVEFGKITYIDTAAFAQCSKLKEVNLPGTCYKIGNYAFSNCKSLELFTTPYLEEIGECAFYKCTALKKINTGKAESIVYYSNTLNAESINYHAFYKCSSLERITLSKDSSIGEYAFEDCTALEDVSFGYGDIPKYIHANSFKNTALVNNHKEGVLYIDEVALCYKAPEKAATTIKIKDGTKHIAAYCLYKIKGVKQIYLPSSVKVVEEINLCECKDLKRVYIAGKKTEFAKYSCDNINQNENVKYYVKSNAYRVIEHFESKPYNYTTNWNPDKTKSVNAVGKTKSTAKITWKKQGYVSGYEVYMKTSKNGKWKKVATLKGSDSTSYTQKGLSKNKTYYFRVRAYKTVYDKTYYGAYSTTDAAKTKKK